MRDCYVTLVCGKKRVGKTYTTIQTLDEAVAGNRAKGIKPRRALIFDVNNEFSEFDFNGYKRRIKAIALKDVGRFSVNNNIEIRRIAPFHDDGKKMSINDMQDVLNNILDVYRNGILLVEDINKYIGDSINGDLIGNLATVRHIGIDLICHYQMIGRCANPKLLGNANFIRFHKTIDTVSRHKDKFQEKTEILSIAECVVNYQYANDNERFYLYVNVDENKILGGRDPIAPEHINLAIKDYISSNYSTLVKPLMQKIDFETGDLLYKDRTLAMQAEFDRLKKTYF